MHKKLTGYCLLLLVSLIALYPTQSGAATTVELAQADFFEEKIRPVLVNSCYECHSAKAEKVKGGLLLDTKDGMSKGGDSGEAVLPGDTAKSLLLQVMRHDLKDANMAMPPKKPKLPASVIADFEAWVKMGAPDPRAAVTTTTQSNSGAPKAVDHWAFKPVSHPAVPQVEDPTRFVTNPIDNFILARLSANNLTPTPKADKYTLLRRVSYDLTGLPPTPEEVENFIADESPTAFEKVVDRLLDAPSYGERWGRHWLDIARYADTSGDRQAGRATMTVYSGAWTYRDYVINAFNKDLPYDQFILQQIAADRLPESKNDKSMLAALGFLTVGKRFMGNENDLLDDRIDVVTKGLMGLTGACARCHDHKFDPIPTRDYYALHGVFASSEEPAEGPLLEVSENNPEYQNYLLEAAKITQEDKTYIQSEGTRLICGILERAGDYLMAMREAGSTADPLKKNGNFRLWAKQKGLKAEIAAVCLDQVSAAEVRNKKNPDPILGPWFALRGLPADQFSEKAPVLLEEMRTGARHNTALVEALIEKAPGSVEDVAQVYNTVFARLHKELGLSEYEGIKAKRGSAPELRKTLAPLQNAGLESLRNDLFGSNAKWLPEERILAKTLGAAFLNPQAAIRGKMASLNLTHAGAPVRAMTLVDKARPKDSNLLIRGEAGNLGPQVPRHFLTLLGGAESKPFTDGSGRLELARAIANPENPLTARVIVNRVWQWHFGQAIVRTVSDFGTRSEPPTHPELIDFLANYLVENNWCLKKLNKFIVMSGAYQQDSRPTEAGMALDPTNQWLWNQL
ncbi:MAG: PSD1 and planctomycete cytochrome C domain-containing protein [Verrucomicrobiota bacterium]